MESAVSKSSALPADRSREESMRGWGEVLSLWRLCGNAACRRARICRGHARVCFPRNFVLLPEGVQAWFVGLGEAQENGLTFDEAMDWLDAVGAGEAFRDWNEAVAASLGEADMRAR